MALFSAYKTAIDLVDSSVLLSDVIDGTYGYFEFSYSCSVNTYTIRGGSFVACEHGAVHLLEAMGFRFFGPTQEFWRRNNAALAAGSLPKNLTQTKTQFSMPSSSYGQQYGNGWRPTAVPGFKTTIEADTNNWLALVGWLYQPRPSGHRQQSVVQVGFPSYFAANPHLIVIPQGQSFNASTTRSFKLWAMTAGEKDYVAQLAASYLLNDPTTSAKLATYGRCEYDANDGDPNTSDDYFAHAVAVCQYVRSGVPALEGKPAKAGVPNAELGVYAYAGHKAKPSFDVRPYIYVGVALAFSPPNTWLPRMTAHNGNSVAIVTRDYLDPHQYSMGMPMNGRRLHKNYPDSYDAYYAAGCRGMVGGDGNGNFLLNMVGNRHLNMKLRTASYTYDQARDDVVDGLFGGDAAVADFYDYMMDPFKSFQRYSLYDLFLIVDQMIDGWYKTYFEQLLFVAYEYLTLPTRPQTPVTGDAYDLALTLHMKHVTAMALSQIFHSYGHLRRLCGSGNTPSGGAYGHLYFEQNVTPYYTGYVLPTHSDYLTAKAALAASIDRASGLDDTDTLMVVHNITPTNPPNRIGATGTSINCLTTAAIAFVGPGSVTQTGDVAVEDPDNPGEFIQTPFAPDPITYDSTLNIFQNSGAFEYSHSGGMMFVRGFPTLRIDQASRGDLWAYVPGRCAGDFKAENESRYRFEDQIGEYDVTPSTPQNDARMNSLGPGQIKVSGSQSSGFGMISNGNVWLSLDPTKALLPAAIAAEDFPALSVATPG